LLPASPLPDWMRPDRAKVILLPAQLAWRQQPVDVAVPVGPVPDPAALQWLKDFTAARRRLLLYGEHGDWYAFGTPEFQVEMADRLRRGEKLW
jgi:hypothetical protein